LTTPVVYPNPCKGRDVLVDFTIAQPVKFVSLEIVTDAYRKVHREVVLGNAAAIGNGNTGFVIGRNTVRLSLGSLRLANGVYYLVVRLPDGTKAIGKLVILR